MFPFRMADPQSHKFVPAGATRPPTRRQIGSTCRFFPPLWSVFGPLFVAFSFFSESCDFVKVELPSGPELDFEGPRSLKILLFLFWSLANFCHRFLGS